MSRRLLPLFSLLVFSFAAHAGVWGERGISQRFVANGDLVYAADGRGVAVYDVADPAHIRRIDVESSADDTTDLALFGATDLVSATTHGIDRFTVAGDGTLTRVSSTEQTGGVAHIAANANYVAAANDQQLYFYQRSANGLDMVRHVNTGDAVRALVFAGNRLYAAVARGAVLVYEPPSEAPVQQLPVRADSLAYSGTTVWAGSYDKALTAIDVRNASNSRVAGNAGSPTVHLLSIAASGTRIVGFEAPNTIRVFDGTDVDHPALVATFNDWVDALAASGDRIFVSGPAIDSEGLRYETGTPLRVYVNNQLAGQFNDLQGPVSGVWTDGSLAYVVDPPYLRVLDVSKTDMPRELSHVLLPDTQERIRVKDGLAVVYGRTKVHLIDVSDPLNPKYLSTWNTQGHYPSDAVPDKNVTFIEANEHSGMHIVDWTDPTFPYQVGGRKWHYRSMTASADAIYALEASFFVVLEISDRTKIIDHQYNSMTYLQVDIAPPGADYPQYLVMRGPVGVRVYSLEDRYAPRLRADLNVEDAGVLGTGDGVAYVTRSGSLYELNLANPTGMTDTGMRVSAPQQISVAGEKIVVADRYAVRVFGPDTASPVPDTIVRRRGVRH